MEINLKKKKFNKSLLFSTGRTHFQRKKKRKKETTLQISKKHSNTKLKKHSSTKPGFVYSIPRGVVKLLFLLILPDLMTL